MNFETVDIIEYFESSGISYTVTGKNLSKGWIGIRCPFCDDHSNHLGIHLESKVFSCFKCGTKGNIIKLIQELEDVDWKKAISIIQQYSGSVLNYENKQEIVSNKFPKMNPLGVLHKEYLASRGFDPELLERKYKLKIGGNFTKYQTRLIIPFFENRRMITFTSRDISGKSEIKYLHPSRTETVITPKDTVFNIDTVRNSCLVVEGCFDVFRMGDGAVSLSGTKYTQRQVSLLSKIDRVFVLFDPEPVAQAQAKKLGNELSFLTRVEVIQLDLDRDPADMTEQEAIELKKELSL
jgi:DNA primase